MSFVLKKTFFSKKTMILLRKKDNYNQKKEAAISKNGNFLSIKI